MRFFIKVALIFVVLAGATVFVLQDQDNQNLDFIKNMFPDLSKEQKHAKNILNEVKDKGEKLKKSLAPPTGSGDIRTLYKWKDDNGVWQFTEEEPAGRTSEKIVVDPNANIVPSENM